MAGSISELLRQSRNDRPTPAAEADDNAAETHLCYAKLRGMHSVAFMLELRLPAGDCDGFDYGLLSRCTFDRSAGVTLHFASGKVTIRGKNLRPLFEGILSHRVIWVEVAASPESVSRDPEATVVTAIEIEAAG